jgi:hypothetical protein
MSQDLDKRIRRLERQNVVMITLILICVSALVVAWHIRKSVSIPDELVAHSIRVVAADGSNSAELQATSDGWVVLSFRDIEGEQRATLMMTPSGKPSLTFFESGKPRLDLGVVDGPTGEEFSLQLADTNRKIIWWPGVTNAY